MREGIPKTPYEIQNRLNEITFNASLHKELRALGFLWEPIKHEGIKREAYQDGCLHRIHAEEKMARLSVSSKMNAEKEFIDFLFEMGRASAEDWIAAHYQDPGKKNRPGFLRRSLRDVPCFPRGDAAYSGTCDGDTPP